MATRSPRGAKRAPRDLPREARGAKKPEKKTGKMLVFCFAAFIALDDAKYDPREAKRRPREAKSRPGEAKSHPNGSQNGAKIREK